MTAMRNRVLWALATVLIAGGGIAAWQARPQRRPAPPVQDVILPKQTGRKTASAASARRLIAKLAPLHSPLGEPRPGDWLARHDEPGQTFVQYLKAKPVTPTGRRTVIYVQPLGEFTTAQRKIVTRSAEYLSLYFTRPVKTLEALPLETIPESARRVHPSWGMPQVLTTYVLDDVLQPRLPADAAAYICFTASDLWPGRGWNFVFGQASLQKRVGVWSIYRNGDPGESQEAFRTCLRRTLKTATHETGHMFSIRHCTAYECNMCGSNNREESDRQPLYLGPECHAKICWATGCDPLARCRALADYCERNGLEQTRDYYQQAVQRLTP